MGKKKHKVLVFPSFLASTFPKKVDVWVMVAVALPSFILVLLLFWLVSLRATHKTTASIAGFFPPVVNSKEVYDVPSPTPKPSLAPAPLIKDTAATPSAVTARSAIAIDVASEKTLYAKDEKLQLWPASTTKVMTAIVVLDEYSLDDVVTVTNPVSTGSRMGLVAGENITVENLLYGMLIQSANDAAYALADFHPSGRAGFVDKMNEKSVELGLENTHFYDPAGFDNDKQYTTASDLATLSLAALKNKIIARMVSIPLITISDNDYIHFHTLKNVNQLLGAVPGVAGIKTGWTENAKENLINLTKRNGHEVLTVVLGSEDRFGETRALTEWAFGNYSWDN